VQGVYDYRNCQSLFGYAAAVHVRSGGQCALCGFGRDGLDFDRWRQLTVEHLLGRSQGGYRDQIRVAVAARFAVQPPEQVAKVVDELEAANTVTACSFCNSMTSRDRAPYTMVQLLAEPGPPPAVVGHVKAALEDVLQRKRKVVSWKLESVQAAFERDVAERLRTTRTGP